MVSKKSDNEIMSFSVTRVKAREIEKLTEDIGYSNRSELIRDAIQMLGKSKLDLEKMKGTLEGVIITLYDHSAEADVSRVRHGNMSLVKSFMHTDFNERKRTCCDVLFFSGQAEKIKRMVFDIEVIRNVNEVKMFIA